MSCLTDPDCSPVYGVLSQPTMVDYPRHMAAMFFVAGCNFRCGFCHNRALLGEATGGLPWTELTQRCADFADNWVDAAVISGGEPTLVPDLARLIRFFADGWGWPIKLDSNGSRPAILAGVLDAVDYVAMDVKCGPASYPGVTGFAETGVIGESIALLRDRAADYEFRTTVLEDVHNDADMHALGEWIAGAKRYVLQPFVPRGDLPDPRYRQHKRTSPDRLKALAELMRPYADEVIVRGEDV